MIAIPNMELPKGCDECPLTDGIRCKARDKDIKEYVLDFFESYHEKPTDCPLIDIVRCGECEHWYNDADCGMACEFTNMGQPINGFCNWGERRNDEQRGNDNSYYMHNNNRAVSD